MDGYRVEKRAAIKKDFEPPLLAPIDFSVFPVNMPIAPLAGPGEPGESSWTWLPSCQYHPRDRRGVNDEGGSFPPPPPADFYPRPGRSLLLNLFLKEKANPSSARPVLPRYPWQRGYPRGPICRRIRRTTSSCMQRDRTLQGLSAPQ